MRLWLAAMVFVGWCMPVGMRAQLATHVEVAPGLGPEQASTAPRRTHLILKDGSYQVVMSYTVSANKVTYVSAERANAVEDIPLELVDLPATKLWEERHTPGSDAQKQMPRPAPVLDPELAKEEADRLALTAEVAPDLRLEPQDSVLALDTFRGVPELVPLQQSEGDLNKQTGHSILRGVINRNSSRHQVVQLAGEKANVQMHVNQPTFYIRLDDASTPGGDTLTVDTHGASSAGVNKDARPKAPSKYAIVRVDVRQNARVLGSFNLNAEGRQEDVVATTSTVMPGGHWMKLDASESLLIGEYSLVEILSDQQINLSVWDFGIHPTAPENRDVLRPEKKRDGRLEHRSRE